MHTASQLASAHPAAEKTTSDQAPETRRRPPWLEPSPARTLALLSLALLGLLGLVAVASRGDRPFTGRSSAAREPSTLFWDYLFSVSLGVAVCCFGISLWLLATRGEGRAKLEKRKRNLYVVIFLAALIVGIVLGAYRVRELRNEQTLDPQAPLTRTPSATELKRKDEAAGSIRPIGILLPLLGGLVVLAFVVARRRAHRRAPREITAAEFVDELAALLDDTLDDLRAEPDPRRAVIAAYARTERVLGAYGFPRRPFEAPLEYLDRIAAPLHEVQPTARRLVFELTHLFERAKFSPHTIDSGMKADAIGTLETLRAELRVERAA